MRRGRLFLGYVVLSIAVASLFGILNDQISYTVSPEYYRAFKFHQFSLLNQAFPERVRVAAVGVMASWWMGALLGVATGPAGFLHPTVRRMRHGLFASLILAFCLTLAFALGGLALGFWQTATIDPEVYRGRFIPPGLSDLRGFLVVGTMHKAAYAGGVVCIPVLWFFHFVMTRRAV